MCFFHCAGLLGQQGRLLALGGRRAPEAGGCARVGVDVVERRGLAPRCAGAAAVGLLGRERGLLLLGRVRRGWHHHHLGERAG